MPSRWAGCLPVRSEDRGHLNHRGTTAAATYIRRVSVAIRLFTKTWFM
jgi:hypothetical protein